MICFSFLVANILKNPIMVLEGGLTDVIDPSMLQVLKIWQPVVFFSVWTYVKWRSWDSKGIQPVIESLNYNLFFYIPMEII